MQPHSGQPVEVAGPPLDESDGLRPADGLEDAVDRRVVVIMAHGRGASPRDILSLRHEIDHPGITYLAPAAAGNTWYPHSFLEDKSLNEPGLSSGLHVIGQLVDDVEARGIPRSQIVLLGFSQGACLVSEFAVRNAARYGGVIAFSGGLIGPPGTTWEFEGSFEGTPVFLGCSDRDPHIPLERVAESAAVFERMGAAVTKRIYPRMGHTVNQDEIVFTRDLLSELLTGHVA